MFRVGGQPAIGLGIAMRDGGDVLALGENIEAALARIQADLPIGIEPHLVANQPATVEIAIGEFMELLWQAVAIILGMSFLSLGVRPGLRRGPGDPADAGDRVRDHAGRSASTCSGSRWAP